MLKTYAAKIRNGKVELLEPTQLPQGTRVLVTVLDDLKKLRATSKYAGAFSSGHSDTSERVDEVLSELGFAERLFLIRVWSTHFTTATTRGTAQSEIYLTMNPGI